MASKSKKSAASSSTLSTPQVPSSTSSVKSPPMTPTRMSRVQEKNTLASLNDRLAAYIERNQQLENENANMTKQLATSTEHTTKTINRITKNFDKELADNRRMVDETAKHKAKLEFELDQIKNEFGDIKAKHDKKAKELTALTKHLSNLESQLDAALSNANKANSEKDKLAAEKKEFEAENNRLSQEYGNIKRQFEAETMRRIEAENKLKSKTEEFVFKTHQNEELIQEMRTQRSVVIEEVGDKLEREYDKKLQQSVQELREEYDNQILANKNEMENLYEQKYGELKAQIKRFQTAANAKADEICDLAVRNEALTAQNNKLESERNELSEQKKGLAKKIDEDQARFFKILIERDESIDLISKEKSDLMTEFQELLDTKVQLDNELALYRKLLEGEERRLSLSPRVTFNLDDTPTGSRRTPVRGGMKRKRAIVEEADDSSAFETQHESCGDIDILEDDPEGKFIKLRNKGDKEISLSGWQLIRKSGELETTHKFHRSVKLDKDATVTVYSSDVQGVVSEPPSVIVLKNLKWWGGDQITTVVLNNSGEEIARRETRRVKAAHQRRRILGGGQVEDLFQQEPDGSQSDRCTIC